jgi:ABC-type Fe3+/spermidine/putrescine transport system ATPase subunit
MNKPASKLVVEDLHLQYGDNKILQGVSMTLNPGEVVALLGASGSGKTTLLRSVAGLEQPSRGRISIGDTVLYDGAGGIEMPVESATGPPSSPTPGRIRVHNVAPVCACGHTGQ